MVAGVNAGPDLALLIELQQLEHRRVDELLVLQVAPLVAAHRLVGLHQFERIERELLYHTFANANRFLFWPVTTLAAPKMVNN